MDDFVGKPVSMPVLAEMLRRWLPHVQWTDPATEARVDGKGDDASALHHDGVIDHAVLDERTSGDEELAAAILVDYVDSSGSDLAALRTALAALSADDVRRQAHRIKGASRTVGAHQVSTLAARLEADAATGADDWSTLGATAEALEAAMARLVASLTPAAPARSA